MKHRNPEWMRQNAIDALSFRHPKSSNRLFCDQEKPRLPRAEITELMEKLAKQGYVEKIEIGFMTYYRRRDLALQVKPSYNESRRNEFSLSREPDWFLGILSPLKYGKPVHLMLNDPRFSQLKNYRGTKDKRLVLLIPGTLAGLKKELLLVSVIGSGSCLVRVKDSEQRTADLVSAGIPARLATILLEKLHSLFN